jgi:hypothetical protein
MKAHAAPVCGRSASARVVGQSVQEFSASVRARLTILRLAGNTSGASTKGQFTGEKPTYADGAQGIARCANSLYEFETHFVI